MKTIKIPSDERTPNKIDADLKLITKWNGKFHRGLETKDFIFFINYKEGDENACVIMYRKSDLSLASDNYFAYGALFEIMTEQESEITYISPMMKLNLKLHKEAENA